ncbi:hypothetical protein D9756_009206 [Leucocoprinus leucothites]|uniref:Uncharacterized protein n=1 Tax=Leucocoprinus leucothites TaxID=201217 RepID=A0A8H5FV80_9AGAR|nr:hypothetical protein D9756_009206 [Leucoagaricus leucothites]
MLAESLLQHRPSYTSTPFIRVCSQCSVGLGSQHPLSSDLCTRCSMRFKDSYPGNRRPKVIGDGDKSDQVHGARTPALYILNPSGEGASSLANRNMKPLDSPRSTSVHRDEVRMNDKEAEPLGELEYPTESPVEDPPASPRPSPISGAEIPSAFPLYRSRTTQPSLTLARSTHADLSLQTGWYEASSSFNQHDPGCDARQSAHLKVTELLWPPTQPQSPPQFRHNIRTCSTRGCEGLIVPSSTCLRCVKCIKSEWRACRSRLLTPKSPQSSPLSILRTDPLEKGKRKSVSWADQQMERNYSTTDSSNGWMSRIKRVRLKLPEPPLPSPEDDFPMDRPLSRIRVQIKLPIPDKLPSPVSDDSPDELCLLPRPTSTLQYSPLVESLLGDSDLSELTDTSSESSDSDSDGSSTDSGVTETEAPHKLVIRIPARSPSTAASSSRSSSPKAPLLGATTSPYTKCANTECHRYLPPNRLEHLCTWCFLRQSRREEKKLILHLISHELLSGDVVPGARLCTPCQHVMPPRSQYAFNDCCSCRIQGKLKHMKGTRLERNKVAADLADEEEVVIAAMVEENTIHQPLVGRCRNRDCGVVIHGSPECWQCMSRRLKNRTQRGKTRGGFSAPVSDKDTGKLLKGPFETSCSRRGVQRPVNSFILFSTRSFKANFHSSELNLFTPYPEYRCQHELLADFHLRVLGFMEVQNIHSLYLPRDPPGLSVFGFDGQFSVVALDFDLLGRRDAVESAVWKLKGELQRLGTLQFEADKTVSANENGIFTRFLCIHRLYNPFGPPYPDQEPAIMQGELEIAVLLDSSHDFLPGQKTVVRFRLVG